MSYLNLKEILKDAPVGTKLYSPIYGNVEFYDMTKSFIGVRSLTTSGLYYFHSDGTYAEGGECLLFPSKDNQDWSTFKLPDTEFRIGDYVEVDGGAFKICCIEEPSRFGFDERTYDLISLDGYPPTHRSEKLLKKINRFDYKYLKPWDRILSRLTDADIWCADTYCNKLHTRHLTHLWFDEKAQYLPVNDETIGLLGTRNDAPEFYRKAWEETDD